MPENKDDIDLEGWNLHRAARGNRVDIAKALIARGEDVNAIDWVDETPLSTLTIEGDYLEIARLLIENGADVNFKNDTDATPLHWAATSNFTLVAQLLIDHGADVNAEDENGYRPLHLVPPVDFPEGMVARILIGNDANTTGIDLSWMENQ